MQKKSSLIPVYVALLIFTTLLCGSIFWFIGQQKTGAGEIALYQHFLMQEGKAEHNNFLQIRGVAGLLAKNRMLIEMLEGNFENNSPKKEEFKEHLNQELREIAKFPHFSVALIFDRKGNCILSSLSKTIGKNYSFRPYFQQALKQKYGLYAAMGVTDKTLGIYYSTPIRSNGAVIGVAMVKFGPSFFEVAPLIAHNKTAKEEKNALTVGIALSDGVFFSTKDEKLYTLSPLSEEQLTRMINARRFPTADVVTPLHFPEHCWHELQRQGFIRLTDGSTKKTYLLFLESIFNQDLFLLHLIEEGYFNQAYNSFSQSQKYLQTILLAALAMLLTAFIFITLRHLQFKRTTEDLVREKERHNQSLNDSITRIKQEEELSHLLYMALEQSATSIIITDLEGDIEYVNKATYLMTGYSRNELLGKNPRILKSDEHEPAFYAEIWSTITSGQTWHGRIRNLRKDGVLYWGELFISPISNRADTITHYLAIKNDITERLAMERELRDALFQAEAANRVKSEFLANMSHEIRTPMNAVIGMSRLVLESELTVEQNDLIASVYSSATSLLTLLNDILDLSKIEAGQLTLEHNSFSLFSLIDTVKKTMQTLADEKGISFQILAQREILPDHLKGDEFRLRQILINLINNAIKFTDKGAIKFEIKLLASQSDNSKSTIGFSVADTGIGIPAEKLLHIFDNFSQADSTTARKYGGSGLGLAISRQLVEMMGGSLTVVSEVDSGSVFSFFIQLETAAGPPPEFAEKAEKLNLLPATILLVDDLSLNRKLALMVLKKGGHQVILAEDGRQALEILAEKSFDLVLMDLQMPVMDGYRTTAIIRSVEAGETIPEIPADLSQKLQSRLGDIHLPVIALTAHAMAGDREKCLKAGMDDYLTKPFVPDEIFALINRHLPVSARSGSGAEFILAEATEDHLSEPSEAGASLTELVSQHLKKEYQLDDEQVKQLIKVSRQNLQKNLELSQKECELENFIAIKQAGHALKGILLNMGLKVPAEYALKIEDEALSENATECHKLVVGLLAELQEFIDSWEAV
ncbi:MAG: response regulator [Deltaproteobacteria bacterium]|nr:response regulator [Candidatus Tharpella aukensis]